MLQEDTIVIRLARNLSREERQEHIQNLLRRMMGQVLQEQRKKRIAPFRHLLDGGESLTVHLASGRIYRIILTPGSHTKATVLQTRPSTTCLAGRQGSRNTTPHKKCRGWIVEIGPHLRRTALHRLLWNLLARAEMPRMENIVRIINRTTLRVPIQNVKIAFAKSQWGSCSPKGVIMLNTALLFLPQRILHYVIVHELAHRLVQNHSPRYWEIVKNAMPNYRRAYQELQNYRLPSL
ncbi:M48 family metallopeptidase [Candidatus Peregrinibacteria bacterium]|nr:M48 family metallopeptidase [Candidatus Peregrinibacteria bacterium]